MKDLRWAALASTLLVLPFLILESLNATLTARNAPGLIVLFALLWLLPFAFIALLMAIVQRVRAGKSISLLGAAVVIVLVFAWGSLLVDQMPCFLGVPNCD